MTHDSSSVRAAGAFVAIVFAGAAGAGECPHWDAAIGQPGMSGFVAQINVLNSGDGPALYASGWYIVAGDQTVNNIARWDPAMQTWSPLGPTGFEGTNDQIRAAAVFDDGSGPALYVGGWFSEAGGVPAAHIARWDGSQWSEVGGGVDGNVHVLHVHDDGTGPALYVGGSFNEVGPPGDTLAANRIARWDGSEWAALGTGSTGTVWAMATLDDGLGQAPGGAGGPSLYAGSTIGDSFGGPGGGVGALGRWDGQQWHPLGSGVSGGGSSGSPFRMIAFDDGDGEALYIGGGFTHADGLPVNGIARWDGQAFTDVGGGVNVIAGENWVSGLGVFDDGTGAGERLYIGGRFTEAGGTPVSSIAVWDHDSQTYLTLGPPGADGLGGLADPNPVVMREFDDGDGPALYVGGVFTEAGGEEANFIAAWRGCPVDEPIPGDLTGDGTVGVDDLLVLLAAWGRCDDCDDCPADLTGDCTVGVDDLLILLAHWG